MKNINKDKKGFTLIELIAVLVILAIITLIVTPLVLNIVKNTKDSANKRSVDAYGRAIDLAVATYLLDNGDFPTSIEDLKLEYSGSEVVCNVKQLNEDSSVYLSECTVGGKEVKDSNTEDGWYHYGKTSVTLYQSYKIGDIITYNGMNFYVIADSDENSDSVTMLKAEPLTVDEVNTYGVGHVNRYTINSIGTADNQNGYGGMAYYSSETCGFTTPGYWGSRIETGCTTDYEKSEVKYAIDAWVADKIKSSDLKEDATGYKVRLITKDEFFDNLGYEVFDNGSATFFQPTENTPEWVYNSDYWYWTMSLYEDYASNVWSVTSDGNLNGSSVGDSYNGSVRPVITLLKSSLS